MERLIKSGLWCFPQLKASFCQTDCQFSAGRNKFDQRRIDWHAGFTGSFQSACSFGEQLQGAMLNCVIWRCLKEDEAATVGVASSGTGPSAAVSSDVTSVTIIVSLTSLNQSDRRQSEIEGEIRKALTDLAGARVEVGSGGNGTKLEITLAGDDPIVVDDAANALEAQLRTLKGIGAVTTSASIQAPEIRIVPDFTAAAALSSCATFRSGA
jgi:Cu/Ag efflux pump CusA